MDEKRRNYRMELSATLVMKPIGAKEEGSPAAIQILDVSRSGIGFTTPVKLQKDTAYEVDLTLWSKDTIHTFLNIMREKPINSGYEYGATFIGMSETDKQRISVYEDFISMGEGKMV